MSGGHSAYRPHWTWRGPLTTINIGPVIRPATGHNRYCGPGALSIILRIDTGEAAALLRKVTGRRQITGVHEPWMRRALESKGYRVQSQPVPDKITLAGWLKEHPVSQRGTKVYLITAGNHYVVVQGRRGGCNQTKGPVALKDMKKRRGIVGSVVVVYPPTVEAKKKVAAERKLQPFKTVENALAALAKAKEEEKRAQARVIELTKRVQLTRVAVAEQAKRASKNQHTKLLRLAKAAGITIERESMAGGPVWWVMGPKAIYGDGDGRDTGLHREDPCEGSHGCHYPSEVDEIIEIYLADLALAAKQAVAA